MSPEEYAQRVTSGELRDLVLSFQMREGFTLRGVMPNYLRDPRSANFGSLIGGLNPDYQRPPAGARKARLACGQYQMRKVKSFADFERQVTYFVEVAADYRADFVLLPEFVSVQLLSQEDALSPVGGIRRLATYEKRFTGLMSRLAARHGLTIIAGSHPVAEKGKLHNVAFVCIPSGEIVGQPKLHITPNERKWWGISGGHTLRAIDTPKGKIGVLIRYDVEFPEAARYLADQGAEILFVPFCTDNRQGYLRVRYCAQARAIENQIYVALAGNVGDLPDVGNLDINYGQAAVLTPSDFAFARDGIAAEADSNEETLLVCDVDLDDLHASRSDGTVPPASTAAPTSSASCRCSLATRSPKAPPTARSAASRATPEPEAFRHRVFGNYHALSWCRYQTSPGSVRTIARRFAAWRRTRYTAKSSRVVPIRWASLPCPTSPNSSSQGRFSCSPWSSSSRMPRWRRSAFFSGR